MKNAVIAILALLSACLLYREFSRKPSEPATQHIAEPKASPHNEQPAVGRPAPEAPTTNVQRSVTTKALPTGVLSPALAGETRYTLLRDVAWRYAKFLANHRLSAEKANLLLDLLVDQRMAGLEAEIQTGTGDVTRVADKSKVAEASALNQKMLEDLIGTAGVAELEASGAEQSRTSAADTGLIAIEASP